MSNNSSNDKSRSDALSGFDVDDVSNEEAENALASLAKETEGFDELDISQTFKPFASSTGLSGNDEIKSKLAEAGDAADLARSDEDYELVLNGPGRPVRRPVVTRSPVEVATAQLAEESASAPESAAPASPAPVVTEAAVPTGGNGVRGMLMAAAALIAVVGTGIFYVQGTQQASSGTATEISIDPSPSVEPAEAALVASPERKVVVVGGKEHEAGPFRFNDTLVAEDPVLNGKSLATLIEGVAPYTPIEGLPESEWAGQNCASCHEWSQALLCEQGADYLTNGVARTERNAHPYGGAFKRKLLAWANHGCR